MLLEQGHLVAKDLIKGGGFFPVAFFSFSCSQECIQWCGSEMKVDANADGRT